MVKGKRRRRQEKEEFKYEDFKVVLELSERLAQYLREWLHLDKGAWDFALDRIRQHQAGKRKAYKEWSKSKGKGKGRRYFAAPCNELKLVQTAILQRFLMHIMVHCCRHGNQPGSSIISNAEAHEGAKAVFSVDIVNAFPSVFRSRIRANLKKPFGYGLRQFGVEFSEEDIKQMLEALVDLVCLHDRLPQGPPTSPRIFDLVCMKMDTEIRGLLERNSTPFQWYRYTAYADNLTISSNDEIPEELREAILGIVSGNGFIPHFRADKTKYFSPETGEVPVVTGLVIHQDGRITMAPKKVNQLRARLHTLLGYKTWGDKVRSRVAGTLGYIRMIYPKKLPSRLREVVDRAEKHLETEKLRQRLRRIDDVETDRLPEEAQGPISELQSKAG